MEKECFVYVDPYFVDSVYEFHSVMESTKNREKIVSEISKLPVIVKEVFEDNKDRELYLVNLENFSKYLGGEITHMDFEMRYNYLVPLSVSKELGLSELQEYDKQIAGILARIRHEFFKGLGSDERNKINELIAYIFSVMSYLKVEVSRR